eukprot:TRINITY_DN11817_c0_g1_i1.p1 TRINITY_DN11817_c0_g1~~TRINITY_DN11817_c0_g1_i1.p1  ORF type:complete len:833 (-),score=191.32 TRINITY_DN11817_c0_g1_i1:8-2482(-)
MKNKDLSYYNKLLIRNLSILGYPNSDSLGDGLFLNQDEELFQSLFRFCMEKIDVEYKSDKTSQYSAINRINSEFFVFPESFHWSDVLFKKFGYEASCFFWYLTTYVISNMLLREYPDYHLPYMSTDVDVEFLPVVIKNTKMYMHKEINFFLSGLSELLQQKNEWRRISENLEEEYNQLIKTGNIMNEVKIQYQDTIQKYNDEMKLLIKEKSEEVRRIWNLFGSSDESVNWENVYQNLQEKGCIAALNSSTLAQLDHPLLNIDDINLDQVLEYYNKKSQDITNAYDQLNDIELATNNMEQLLSMLQEETAQIGNLKEMLLNEMPDMKSNILTLQTEIDKHSDKFPKEPFLPEQIRGYTMSKQTWSVPSVSDQKDLFITEKSNPYIKYLELDLTGPQQIESFKGKPFNYERKKRIPFTYPGKLEEKLQICKVNYSKIQKRNREFSKIPSKDEFIRSSPIQNFENVSSLEEKIVTKPDQPLHKVTEEKPPVKKIDPNALIDRRISQIANKIVMKKSDLSDSPVSMKKVQKTSFLSQSEMSIQASRDSKDDFTLDLDSFSEEEFDALVGPIYDSASFSVELGHDEYVYDTGIPSNLDQTFNEELSVSFHNESQRESILDDLNEMTFPDDDSESLEDTLEDTLSERSYTGSSSFSNISLPSNFVPIYDESEQSTNQNSITIGTIEKDSIEFEVKDLLGSVSDMSSFDAPSLNFDNDSLNFDHDYNLNFDNQSLNLDQSLSLSDDDMVPPLDFNHSYLNFEAEELPQNTDQSFPENAPMTSFKDSFMESFNEESPFSLNLDLDQSLSLSFSDDLNFDFKENSSDSFNLEM